MRIGDTRTPPSAKLLTDKIQQERAMAVIKAMRCASESAVIARRRRSTCKNCE